jgi:hypothetical protein
MSGIYQPLPRLPPVLHNFEGVRSCAEGLVSKAAPYLFSNYHVNKLVGHDNHFFHGASVEFVFDLVVS